MKAVIFATLAALTLHAQDSRSKRGVNFYSLEKEAALGASLAAEIRRNATPIDSPAVRDFVYRIGNRLSAQIAAAPFPYTFAVIADDWNIPTHEPEALPGGYIFVPAALILATRDQAEFAGMLAHAMAHVAARDYTRVATRGEIANFGTIPLVFLGGWPGYERRQTGAVAIPMGLLNFRRELEAQADVMAVGIAAAAGFDPSGLVRYIGGAQTAAPETSRSAFPVLPTPEARVSSMEKAIQALPVRTYAAPDAVDFARVQAEVRGLLPVERKPTVQRN